MNPVLEIIFSTWKDCVLSNLHFEGFFWRKSAQDTGSFDNGNSVQKEEVNQSGDIYFIENIPKTSENAAHILQCEFFLKAPL